MNFASNSGWSFTPWSKLFRYKFGQERRQAAALPRAPVVAAITSLAVLFLHDGGLEEQLHQSEGYCRRSRAAPPTGAIPRGRWCRSSCLNRHPRLPFCLAAVPLRLFIGFASVQPCQLSPSLNGFGCAGTSSYRGSLDGLHCRYGLSFTLNRLLPTFPRGNAVSGGCQLNDLIGWMRLSLTVFSFHGRTHSLTIDKMWH